MMNTPSRRPHALLAGLAVLVAPTAVLAQSAAPASNSSVVVYGLVDAVVRHASNVSADGKSDNTMEDGLITGSRLGFRINEDLGAGLRAQVVMESGFDPSTGTSAQGTTTADYGQEAANPRFWGREINLALRSDWGGVTLGRQYTVPHQFAIRFQPLGNPNSTALSVFSSHHVARQDNVLRVDTRLAGVELQASRTFGEQAGDDSANASWAVGAGYTGSDFAVAAFYEKLNNRAGTETRKIAAVGGNYRFNPVFALYAGYMQRSAEVSLQENKVWSLGANIEFGPFVTLSLQYFDDQQSGSAALDGSRKVAWAMGTYHFSKRTDAYLSWDQNRVADGYAKPSFMGTLGTQNAVNLGLRHKF